MPTKGTPTSWRTSNRSYSERVMREFLGIPPGSEHRLGGRPDGSAGVAHGVDLHADLLERRPGQRTSRRRFLAAGGQPGLTHAARRGRGPVLVGDVVHVVLRQQPVALAQHFEDP